MYKTKQKILKGVREKGQVTYKGRQSSKQILLKPEDIQQTS
jgi:hypothetical protein